MGAHLDTSNIVRCVGCGKPHRVYNYYYGDQSRCSACRKDLEAEADMSRDEWLAHDSLKKLARYWF